MPSNEPSFSPPIIKQIENKVTFTTKINVNTEIKLHKGKIFSYNDFIKVSCLAYMGFTNGAYYLFLF